jgi:hypothetical protein
MLISLSKYNNLSASVAHFWQPAALAAVRWYFSFGYTFGAAYDAVPHDIRVKGQKSQKMGGV